ncbi:Arginine utilization protein RocB [Caloramator quimbayensis]|uniref:Arginine utilization protein RocB n=1 Tax=Caloramator quimbayensis TaxID=1147123 RepID=A0A1T4XPE9_9CLOT|nr:M20/M25/M40 family metallo-hydrolase [Caloramator quimbayensis]SKA91223.1 Arginine utilization protein RocB [Caloramator quimbayensis]
MELKQRNMQTMLELVKVPGISGTESENLTAGKIYGILSEFEYFKTNSENLKLIEIKGDPYRRCFVSALYKSKYNTNKTIILTGHFDVVGVEEFGHLKDFAFSPVELTNRIDELELSDEAKHDLESNDYIFGRGTADMKFGLSLYIELLRDICNEDNLNGNVLFLAVPSEESNSEGMLGALPYLTELQENGLEFISLFLSECSMPKHDDTIKYIYLGSVGKIMPLFFFAGKETHVHEPFTGLNANLLASELNRLFELNSDFCDRIGDDTVPPPTCLKQMDLKELYSVQTPLYAASYYNLMTLDLNANDLIIKLKNLCEKAFINAFDIVEKRRIEYEGISGEKINKKHLKYTVLTYEELFNEVKKIYGESFNDELRLKVKKWQDEKMDNQNIAINIVKETYEKYPNKVPTIVIAFSPPYYPDKSADLSDIRVKKLHNIINEIIEIGKREYGQIIEKQNYFTGICDLSYTGIKCEEKLNIISSNLLGLGLNYNLPIESLKKLNIPAANFGGLGKDFHKYTERLNISYSFDVVPKLYKHIISKIFD